MAFTQPIHVLLVEDDEADQHLTRRSLKRVRSAIEVHSVGSVKAARRFLQREGAFEDAQRPVCLILDMHLSDGRGEALLDWMAQVEEFADLPVIVFSDGRSETRYRNVVCSLKKPDHPAGYRSLEEGLGAILFAAADSERPPANDNFAAYDLGETPFN